jgi:hypothetical protein
MAGSISRCPPGSTAPAGTSPAHQGTSSTRNGRYMAAVISATVTPRCPRCHIQPAITTAMLVAMVPAATSGRASRSSGTGYAQTGPISSIPSTIATSISPK